MPLKSAFKPPWARRKEKDEEEFPLQIRAAWEEFPRVHAAHDFNHRVLDEIVVRRSKRRWLWGMRLDSGSLREATQELGAAIFLGALTACLGFVLFRPAPRFQPLAQPVARESVPSPFQMDRPLGAMPGFNNGF